MKLFYRLYPMQGQKFVGFSKIAQLTLLLVFCLLLSSCGLFASPTNEAEAPTQPARTPVPTFTPTPLGPAPTDTLPPPPPATATSNAPAPTNPPAPAAAPITPTATITAVQPTATTTQAQVTVSQASINVRSGPGTEYGLVGTANQGERLQVLASNADRSWWKVCCINGQPGWVFGQLVTAENINSVAVDPNIPAPPVVQQPTQAPTQAPVAQATQPQPPPPPTAPPAPPASDPCASIGGDGCKFKLKSGPAFGASGGELKLQLFFIHSGIDGGQPQGSYFVAMFKDGQKLPISDGVRSIALDKSQGTLGAYNYEFSVQAGALPGGSVAGSYTIYVLDGNGERDSKDFAVNVPDGQGLVYIVFDQG